MREAIRLPAHRRRFTGRPIKKQRGLRPAGSPTEPMTARLTAPRRPSRDSRPECRRASPRFRLRYDTANAMGDAGPWARVRGARIHRVRSCAQRGLGCLSWAGIKDQRNLLRGACRRSCQRNGGEPGTIPLRSCPRVPCTGHPDTDPDLRSTQSRPMR